MKIFPWATEVNIRIIGDFIMKIKNDKPGKKSHLTRGPWGFDWLKLHELSSQVSPIIDTTLNVAE